MSKRIIFSLLICASVCFLDGFISAEGEEGKSQKDPNWKTHNYVVTTESQIVYDVNGNGYLEPDETREYLKHRYERITSYGETGVDSDIVREYDANGDGTIDAREAQYIRDDIAE